MNRDEPSEIERRLTPLELLTLVSRVANRARFVADRRLHDDDCMSAANEAVVVALRCCPDVGGVLAYARTVVTREVHLAIERARNFVHLDAAGWIAADEANPVAHDAYTDGDLQRYVAENFTAEEMLDAGVGRQLTAVLTRTPERRVRTLLNRKRNDARSKTTQPINERRDRLRPRVSPVA